MRIGGAVHAPPPSQTGRADFPHPAFQSAAVADGLAQVDVPRCSEGTRQPHSPCGPAHPFPGGPLPAVPPPPSGFPPPRRAQPCGTTSGLVSWLRGDSRHCLPTSLGSTIITRFFATTDALTPTGPFVITGRGSLIHVTRTSDHSVSNHLRFSTRRDPLPQRWPHYGVRASPLRSQARQNRRPNRVHSVRPCGRSPLRTGGSLPVALHPGVSPRCSYFQLLAFQCRSGQGLAPCCSDALSGARAHAPPRVAVGAPADCLCPIQ